MDVSMEGVLNASRCVKKVRHRTALHSRQAFLEQSNGKR